MSGPTLTLADFLLARIAEDEAVARKASGGLDFNWGDYGINPELLTDALFFERFASPARVLAECEAKRRIVVRCQEMQAAAVPMAAHLASATLADLALPYADHPDYRAYWRP